MDFNQIFSAIFECISSHVDTNNNVFVSSFSNIGSEDQRKNLCGNEVTINLYDQEIDGKIIFFCMGNLSTLAYIKKESFVRSCRTFCDTLNQYFLDLAIISANHSIPSDLKSSLLLSVISFDVQRKSSSNQSLISCTIGFSIFYNFIYIKITTLDII